MNDPFPTNYLFIQKRRRPLRKLLLAAAALAVAAGAGVAAWLWWA